MQRLIHSFTALLSELRRRRVYKVAAAYAVAAWVIIEAAGEIAPQFAIFPDSTGQFIIVAAVAMFPFVVALAWVYDVSERGVVVTGARGGEAELTAILFSDLAGYTRLAESDENKAITTLRQSRRLQKRLINRFGGRHVEDAGDGLLAIFPSATSAVKCALAITHAWRNNEPPLRIGIHVGDVREEGSGIAGLGVNIASRLQTLSDAGGIAISEPARDAIRHLAELTITDRGHQSLKNVSRTVQVYDVEGPPPDVPRDPIRGLAIVAFGALIAAVALWQFFPRSNPPSDAELYLAQGHQDLARRNAAAMTAAEDDFMRALAADPRSATAYAGLAITRLLEIDYGNADPERALEEAARFLDSAEHLDPEDPAVTLAAGLLEDLKDQCSAAETLYARTLDKDPDNVDAWIWQGNVQSRLDKPAEAIHSYETALEITQDSPLVLTGMGVGQYNMGHMDAAVEYLQAALALDSEFVPAHRRLAAMFARKGQWVDAIAHAETAVELNPTHIRTLIDAVGILLAANEPERAEHHLAAAEALAPDNTYVRELRAWSGGDTERAGSWLPAATQDCEG